MLLEVLCFLQQLLDYILLGRKMREVKEFKEENKEFKKENMEDKEEKVTFSRKRKCLENL